jgi:hypothetical protein
MKKSYKITEQLLTDLAAAEKARDELVEQVNSLNRLHDFCRVETARDCANIVGGHIGCDMIAQYIRMKYGIKD